MSKRKFPKLPNGYGSIKKLSGKRRNPFGVYPPVTEFDQNGIPKTPPAIAYVDDWYYGFAILTAYRAGTYVPGVYPPQPDTVSDVRQVQSVVSRIISDYSQVRCAIARQTPKDSPTFSEVFNRFYDWKFNSKRQYSKSTKNYFLTAYKHCTVLYNIPFSGIRCDDLQKNLDACPLKYASLECILTLYRSMYSYALSHDLCTINYSASVKINIEDDDEHGVPFSEEELITLWKNQENPVIELVLILCYSGHRISECKVIEVNLEENYFRGGIKTKASKERIVPIHSAILPLVKRRIQRDGSLLSETPTAFRNHLYSSLKSLGIEKHTPHDCRHTFSALCEKYAIRENDRKRFLGHTFRSDITNNVYGHRTLDELREQIEKIKLPL